MAISCTNRIRVEQIQPKTNNISVDASQICAGTVILSITGTADCSGANNGSPATPQVIIERTTFAEEIFFLYPRKDVTTFPWALDPSFLDDLINDRINRRSNRITYFEPSESQNFLVEFSSYYNILPNPLTDTDEDDCPPADPCATDDLGAPTVPLNSSTKAHTLEAITGRPMNICGNSNNVEESILDCAEKNGASAFYDGAQFGRAGEGNWQLVMKTINYKEIWQDQRTKIIWSDIAQDTYNWFKSAGYSKSSMDSLGEVGKETAPNEGFDCNGFPCQPLNPLSICSEVHNGAVRGATTTFNTYETTSETEFKGGFNHGHGIIWRLPSLDDYKLADINGIRKVLPSMKGNFFWTSTSLSRDREKAWFYNGANGDYYIEPRTNDKQLRCIGYFSKNVPN